MGLILQRLCQPSRCYGHLSILKFYQNFEDGLLAVSRFCQSSQPLHHSLLIFEHHYYLPFISHLCTVTLTIPLPWILHYFTPSHRHLISSPLPFLFLLLNLVILGCGGVSELCGAGRAAALHHIVSTAAPQGIWAAKSAYMCSGKSQQ